jgi:hypothetical protein
MTGVSGYFISGVITNYRSEYMTLNNETVNHYIFNLETTKMELHFDKSDYDALIDEQRRELKSNFLWSRHGQCWVSRAKEPNLYYAKQVAKKLGFTGERREGERLSYAEQLERKAERADARADRYDGYAINAAARAVQLQKPITDMRGDIAFFTQPNINSSAGRSFTNRREKMFEQYRHGFEEYRKSDFFKERARTARETASLAQFDDPAYLDRRIRECKKEIRNREKNIVHYEEIVCALEKGEVRMKRYSGEIITLEEVTAWLERELELVEKSIDKQGYLENCLERLGGLKFNKGNIRPGYIVNVQRWGKVEVTNTGPLNFAFVILTGGAAGGTLQAAYAEIIEVIQSEEKKRPPHPFKVGEQFEAVSREYTNGLHDVKTTKTLYEIIKASDTTIQLKATGTDAKPITRKPVKTYSGKWRFSIDDTYGNTFYKEET